MAASRLLRRIADRPLRCRARGVGRRRHSSSSSSSGGTADAENVGIFDSLGPTWWRESNARSGVALLHSLNPARVEYIVGRLRSAGALSGALGSDDGGDEANGAIPLSGLRVLDCGCGGGILSESLAVRGAAVVGLDASTGAIAAAREHSAQGARTASIEYHVGTPDALDAASPLRAAQFDVVCALEVVEHVHDVRLFLSSLVGLLRPGGSLFLSTLNRTALSHMVAIVLAEHASGIVPVGTHNWEQFRTPEELTFLLRSLGLAVDDTCGMVLNPLTRAWSLEPGLLDINYIMHATLPAEEREVA